MKIGLLLVGNKGLNVLNVLVNKFEITFVQSYNDKNVNDNSFNFIKNICKEYNIKFFEGKKVELKVDVDKIFVIGWQYILDVDLEKLVVFHDSILPEYKGWAPTVNYLIEGNSYIGATAFKPTEIVDTGMIYAQKKEYIDYPIKIKDALDKVSDIYSDLIEFIIKKNPEPIDMVGEESFGLWRDDLDYFINFEQPAYKIKRFVDAVGYPYAGSKIKVDDKILTVEDAEVIKGKIVDVKSHLGKILRIEEGSPVVICSSNLIKLKNITDENGDKYTFKKLKIRL